MSPNCWKEVAWTMRKFAMDRNRMLLIASVIALLVVMAYVMFGLNGTWLPR